MANIGNIDKKVFNGVSSDGWLKDDYSVEPRTEELRAYLKGETRYNHDLEAIADNVTQANSSLAGRLMSVQKDLLRNLSKYEKE